MTNPPQKLKMHTPDLTKENIAKLAELFPHCVTETHDANKQPTMGVDFDLLKQELSFGLVQDKKERYQINWPGKNAAVLEAYTPIEKTLRPRKKESVAWDTTQNLFIEGDNLDALKLLQNTYLGKVKMIYIDPPYNTGNDFIYRDKFSKPKTEQDLEEGQTDEEGNVYTTNPESNGKFHSDWLSMMYPRLRLAKRLLREDGVIFISIDDHEQANLKRLCDEIFGEKNFVELFIWRKKSGGGQQDDYVVTEHDYILCYAKNKDKFKLNEKTATPKISGYNFRDEVKQKNYKRVKFAKWGSAALREDRPTMYDYPELLDPDGKQSFPVSPDGRHGRWRYGRQRAIQMLEDDDIDWGKVSGKWVPYEKDYQPMEDDFAILKERSIFYDLVENGEGSNELKNLFGVKDIFSNPKPRDLITHLIYLSVNPEENEIVLDFFAGSGSTASAVYNYNSLLGANVNYILVQLPEKIEETKKEQRTAFNFCKDNNLLPAISEISKERIRRAGDKILENSCHENWKKDIGFRVLAVDSTNMKNVYYHPQDTQQPMMANLVNNIKQGRDHEDLLFQVMLELGIDLTLPITIETQYGGQVFCVGENDLLACFERDNVINKEFCQNLATRKPLCMAFRDASFGEGAMKFNAGSIFKIISPDTHITIL